MTDQSSEVRHTAKPSSTGRLWSRPTPTRLYASAASHERSRRATDVILLALCLLGLVVVGQLAHPPSAFEAALVDLVRAIPEILDVIWLTVVGLLGLWGLLLVAASLVRWRLDILRDQVLGAVGATALTVAAEQIVGSEGTRSLWAAATATAPPPDPVSVRLTLVVAVAVVASPYVTRPFRTFSRWLLGLGAVSLVVLEATTPTGAVLGLLCGTAAAALVHLLLGSSGGRPSLADVGRWLDELGVEVTSLSRAERQRAGVYLLDAADLEGMPLAVRVYGRDAWDSQLLTKAWRALWYRDAEALTLTRLQQAEHEAYVTLLAARDGVPVHQVVRAGRTNSGDALIVLRVRGAPFGPVVDGPSLERAWDTVLALAGAGFAHGDLAPSVLRVDGDQVLLDELAGVVVAPSEDQRRVDLAQLLVATAVMAGPEASVAIAEQRLGADGLAEVLPYLQVAALGPRSRAALSASELDLDDLRTAAAAVAGVEEPKLAQLRRVSTGSLVRAGLLAAAGYFLISTLAGIDLDDLADALRDASIPLLVVALVFGQVPRLTQAESTRSACPRPIPFGPIALLQFAITFVNLAIPSTAARVAVSIRFFQKQGIPPVSAASIGVIDSVCGFVVQVLVLVSVAVFGLGDVEMEIDRPSDLSQGDLVGVLLALGAVVVVVALAVAVVPRTRRWVLDRVRPWIHEALETLAILRSPGRVARLLGANLATEVLFASTLGIVLAAFGTSLPLATLLLVNVSVALFAGIMPVPGGIGVAEGALVVMLTAAGVGEATAFGVAIAYRICTFYLPPIWGAVAYRRLERNGYL